MACPLWMICRIIFVWCLFSCSVFAICLLSKSWDDAGCSSKGTVVQALASRHIQGAKREKRTHWAWCFLTPKQSQKQTAVTHLTPCHKWWSHRTENWQLQWGLARSYKRKRTLQHPLLIFRGAGKIAQWVRVLAAMPGNQSLIPRSLVVEGESPHL